MPAADATAAVQKSAEPPSQSIESGKLPNAAARQQSGADAPVRAPLRQSRSTAPDAAPSGQSSRAQTQHVDPSASPSGFGGPSAAAQADSEDWSAFGQANEPQARQTASVHEGSLQQPNGAARLQESAVPSFEADFPLDHWQGSSQAAQPASADPNPAFDAGFSEAQWQASHQIADQGAVGLAHKGSGDSFGDFNASAERGDFEAGDWSAAPAMPADPFAASASFKDFAALLEPQTGFTASQDVGAEADQLQQPATNGSIAYGLAELHADSSLSDEQDHSGESDCL